MNSNSGLSIASLKHTKAIQELLSSGKSGLKYPILIKYRLAKKRHPSHPEFIFTPVVSAKKIKRAVDRNLLKRRIRAAVQNSVKLFTESEKIVLTDKYQQVQALYIFLDKKIKDFDEIEAAIIKLNQKTIFKVLTSAF